MAATKSPAQKIASERKTRYLIMNLKDILLAYSIDAEQLAQEADVPAPIIFDIVRGRPVSV